MQRPATAASEIRAVRFPTTCAARAGTARRRGRGRAHLSSSESRGMERRHASIRGRFRHRAVLPFGSASSRGDQRAGHLLPKANTVNPEGLKKFFAVVRGDHALSEFEPYGLNEADMAQFNKDHKETGRAWRDHAAFEGYLCNILHISSPKTLTLLHKTQAAKNIGSLDDLFRKYMLDTPRTHALATAAVAQFKELEEAHDAWSTNVADGMPGTAPASRRGIR